MKGFADLADYSEDERINMIGNAVMGGRKVIAHYDKEPIMIAVVVEDDIKADRYIKKLKEKFPDVRVIDRFASPVKDAVTIRLSGPLL